MVMNTKDKVKMFLPTLLEYAKTVSKTIDKETLTSLIKRYGGIFDPRPIKQWIQCLEINCWIVATDQINESGIPIYTINENPKY
jgi:hypothetical protein